MDHTRIKLPPGIGSNDEEGKQIMEAAVAGVRKALNDYPHFCVAELPEGADDKKTFVALAGAVSGETDLLGESSDGAKKRVSFTNVRVDEANAQAPRKTGTRYSRTNLPMAPHTDSSFKSRPHELVAFHCVAHDEAGGESVLVPVEDVIRRLDAETVALLREPVYPLGTSLRPILSGDPGQEEIRYYRTQLDRPIGDGSATLSEKHVAAIDAVDAVLEQSQLFHNLLLRSGEILFMQNRKVMHGRAGFAGESKRHFRRIRLRWPGARSS